MKKALLIFVGTLSLVLISTIHFNTQSLERQQYQEFINNHPFSKYPTFDTREIKKIPKFDRPDLAWEQDFLSTLDPALGRPAKERLAVIFDQLRQTQTLTNGMPGSTNAAWQERGPNNVGGRTRAIMYDPNDVTHKKVWAGSVGGGLWVNSDITNANVSWLEVNGFMDNLAITCLAYDPNNTNIFYAGTGEGWGNSDAIRGLGIWKTTNGGTTWTQILSTTDFSFVHDIVVRNESGTSVVYAAVDGKFNNGVYHNTANAGLQRSTNGGTSWAQVLPNVPGFGLNFVPADIDIDANNKLWVGTKASPYTATDRGGGRILTSTNGTTWTTSHTEVVGGNYGRVAIACAPSNANYVYALVENGNALKTVLATTNGGTSWGAKSKPSDADLGIPASDFTRGQAWYDLVIAVDPNNANTAIVGGIDLFRTTDGATSWSQISKWSNNSNLNTLSCSEVHADQHSIVFKPGSSSQVLFGNDGGVFYSNNIANAATSDVIPSRIKDYNVTQFFACAMHPTANTSQFLAGAQDNGTQRFTTNGVNSTNDVIGGDGAFCFIDQTNPTYQYGSYVYNNYYRSTNGGVSFPTQISSTSNTGRFINPADYDDQLDILYSARNNYSVQRVMNASSNYYIDYLTITGMNSMASHLRVSPYTSTSTTLFVGTLTGELYKITNANTSSATTTNITGVNFPSGNISCVEIGASDNELLVTFSNYGVTSVFYTSNGGTSWTSKEGNLPDMPIRWALFNPNNYSEVILATEVGVWATTNFNAINPTWNASNNGMANVRVDMLQIRNSDQEVIAATHGRGLFSCSGFGASQPPSVAFSANKTAICSSDTVTFVNNSGNATTNVWTITPNTFAYVGGTSSTSLNPKVYFSANGSYSVTLVATNTNGSSTLSKINYISRGGKALPFAENWEDTATYKSWTIENPDNAITWLPYTVGGSSPGTKAMGVNNYGYSASASFSQIDYLVSPMLSFSDKSTVTLTFNHAYKSYNIPPEDSLAISVSSDCGTTWNRVAAYRENGTNNWVTGANSSSSFVPAVAADWCGGSFSSCKTVSLNAYAGIGEVLVRFESMSGYGNNMYIDNINITGTQSATIVAAFAANNTTPCASDIVTFTDASTQNPTTWLWTFVPNSVTFVGGTSASSQNPKVTFNAATTYSVTLLATKGGSSDSEIKTNYITRQATKVPSVSIAASANNICAGQNVTFTPTPTNGGSSPIYKWFVNGVYKSTGATFSSVTLANNNAVTARLISNANCAAPDSVVSAAVTMVVNTVLVPAVSIVASGDTICAGATVMFTATPTNGGVTPSYQWKLNNVNVGTNSATYSSATLANGDVVKVVITSSSSCAQPNTATSANKIITVKPMVTPSISIAASAANNCVNQPVTFTATPTNGGGNPQYNWLKNGVSTGSTGATYTTSLLAPGDTINCILTSSESCVSSATVTSAKAVITIHPLPSVGIASNAALCSNDAPISLSGTPAGGSFSGTGVSGNLFNPATAGAGSHTITYSFTDANGCPNTADYAQVVNAAPAQPTITQTGATLSTSATGVSYQWLLGGNPIIGANTNTYITQSNGTYAVEITDPATGCKNISADFLLTNFSVEDLAQAISLRLFPNPTADVVTVKMQNPNELAVSVDLYNSVGQKLAAHQLGSAQEISFELNLKSFAVGVYTLNFTIGDLNVQRSVTKTD